jgi:hypothetical protein
VSECLSAVLECSLAEVERSLPYGLVVVEVSRRDLAHPGSFQVFEQFCLNMLLKFPFENSQTGGKPQWRLLNLAQTDIGKTKCKVKSSSLHV